MVNKWMRKLGIGMSAIMTVSQLSGMVAMAAPEDGFGDRLEEQFDAEAEDIEDDAESEDTSSVVEEEDIEIVQLSTEELVPPIDLEWDPQGWLCFKVNSSASMFYGAEIEIGDSNKGSRYFYDLSADYGNVHREYIGSYFNSSGTYTIKPYVAADDNRESERVYSETPLTVYFTRPSGVVETPANPRWEKQDEKKFAVAACDKVEHVYQYCFNLYEDGKGKGGHLTTNPYMDFSSYIGDTSIHSYDFTVQAYSEDLSLYANSERSEKSSVFSPDNVIIVTQKDIVDIGKDVNASNIDEKVQQVKDIDNSILKSSLQTSDEALQAMGKIEEEYKNAKGIEVLPATSDVEKIIADKIEMTGAALNVSEGTVQLNVKNQKEAGSSIINTDIYTNIIAFDMSVESSEGIDFSEELEVPVTIAMPIPEGMDSSRLVILHYRADGAEELITPRIENGKAIFAITHFSTFAFAEKKEASSTDTLGNTFSKAEAMSGVQAMDGNHTLKLETSSEGFFTSAKILDSNGSVDTSVNSYIANIVVKYAADGTPEEFYSLVFRKGVWDPSYDTLKDGLYTYLGEQYSVAGGVVNLNVNSLTYTGDIDGWRYIILGHVVKNHGGLVAYGPADDLHWFWIDDEGRCDNDYAAIVNWNGGQFLVHGGRLRTDYTGFTFDPQNESVWYHITNGQVWGDGTITDQSIAGGRLTCNVENGIVKDMNPAQSDPIVNEGGYIVFGSYEQDGNLENGKEPIEWQVLGTDEKGTLVISRYVLDAAGSDVTQATLSSDWLNNGFLNSAFSSSERAFINGEIKLLYIYELKKYCEFDYRDDTPFSAVTYTGGFKGYSRALIAEPTVYAEQQGAQAEVLTQQEYEEKYADYGYSADMIGCRGTGWFVADYSRIPSGLLSSVSAFGGVSEVYSGGGRGIRPAMYITQ